MKLGIIAKDLSPWLYDFTEFLALHKNTVNVEIVYDNEDPETDILRKLRSCRKVWFEGLNNTLKWVLEHAESLEDFPKCTVHLEPHEIDEFKDYVQEGTHVISDIIVRSRKDRDDLYSLEALSYCRIHVVPSSYDLDPGCKFPADEWSWLRNIILSQYSDAYAGNPSLEDHVEMMNLAGLCKGAVKMVGSGSNLLSEYLQNAGGCTFAENADTVLISGITNRIEILNHIKASVGKCAHVVVRLPDRSQDTWLGLIKDLLPETYKVEQYPGILKLKNTEKAPICKDSGPLVSVVIPTYNAGGLIPKAIASVREQTYSNLEILVVDDGSTDGTETVIADLAIEDERIKYIKIEHGGRAAVRNKGIEEAKGSIIAWLDADDEALPGWISTSVREFMVGADICYSAAMFVDDTTGAITLRAYKQITEENIRRLLFKGLCTVCPLLQSSTVVHKSVYDRIGKYDTTLDRCEDYDLWVRAGINGKLRFTYSSIPLAIIHRNKMQIGLVKESLKYYTILALTMLDAFDKYQIVHKSSKVLNISADLDIAHTLFNTCKIYGATKTHELAKKVSDYLDTVVTNGTRLDFLETLMLRNALDGLPNE